ncbi:Alpha/Beta hydrolase protein [Amylostereum chailletii]|nr:Alpha/Beta hydrolase protein [Amylostereum chailletii]
MGGALASIASLSLKAHFPNTTVELFTYGQPRTGNARFADLLEDMVGSEHLYRGVHTFDGVPTIIPESLGYRHHSREYWQFEEPPNRLTVRQCTGQEDPDCSRSVPPTGINVAHDVYFGQLMTVDATLCL